MLTFGNVGRTMGGATFLPLFWRVFESFEVVACTFFFDFFLLELELVMVIGIANLLELKSLLFGSSEENIRDYLDVRCIMEDKTIDTK